MVARTAYLILLALFSLSAGADEYAERLVAAAIDRTYHSVTYDGSYYSIAYPNGDVPDNIGVCTDVIVRAYRAIGVDLQVLVHEDMTIAFESYPSNRIWGLTRPDRNIDHRRVPNLQTFFKRHGEALEVSTRASDYRPGELVTWMVSGNLPHIGMVTGLLSEETQRPLIVHNIGRGPELEDMLFKYPITGRYKYAP